MKRLSRFMVLLCVVVSTALSFNCLAFDNMKRGDKSDTVKEVQEALIIKGYLDGTADGSFGAKTEEAVASFQRDNHLDETGIVGEATFNALINDEGNAISHEAETTAAVDEVTETEQVTEADIAEEVDEPDGVFIKKEFMYSVFGAVMYFIVVKNNTENDVSVNINAVAKNAEASMIGAGTGSIEVLSPGAESVCSMTFDSTEITDIASIDTTLNYSDSSYYKGINNDLQYEVSDTGSKLVVALTNTGENPAQFVEGRAFFFAGDECLDYDWTYFTDDDSEIKPGAMIVKELTYYSFSDKTYDHYELYFDGRYWTGW